jgi:hypothetical protein
MKNFIAYVMFLTLAVSCDSPQSTRLIAGSSALSNPTNTISTGTLTSGTTTGTTTSGGLTTAGFTNCNFTNVQSSNALGTIGVCQSTLDETQIAIRPSVTDTSSRTCLIPTYKDQSGSSTYIGQPQCTYTTQNAVVIGQLSKSRSGYSGYNLNGMMVMKETALTSYFQCMDAYTSYVSQACPSGAATNSSCDSYARSYMSSLCTNFKSTSSYIDFNLK